MHFYHSLEGHCYCNKNDDNYFMKPEGCQCIRLHPISEEKEQKETEEELTHGNLNADTTDEN